ncbi:out at first protein [Neodiprion pinetum]|uniref:Out at first protein n=1 Tax=Neodiprion lecontei TaxID=441921 RepID=A0A6J0BKW2_NEOLC|nr:out at first protein [Neodiprion lecontei]XP_046474746.1 out at first protein [Neodiprion pinetum]
MKTFGEIALVYISVLQCLCGVCMPHLLINVRNQGGDILLETISSNVTDDTISLEFQRSDGTLVTQLVDFRNEVQVIKALVLGEEERGQNQYQVMCFVNHFYKMDFISSDAMSKLRQKNPGTIRIAEEDRGHSNYTMDLFLDVSKSGVISKHVATLCGEAADTTYTRNDDLKQWVQRPGSSEAALMATARNFTTTPVTQQAGNESKPVSLPKCADTSNLWAPCTCSLELCIGWYPCGLKFCKGKGDGKKPASSYRCGIKTCKKCFIFSYYSQLKQNCLWDE